MRKYIAGAVVAGALLGAAGCGDGEEAAAPPKDKGPQCVGKDSDDGLHVLRGGGFLLPGGGGVTYAKAKADGKTRTAVLEKGVDETKTGPQRTVALRDRVTYGGHDFQVTQICSYRVVLRPEAAADRADAAAKPAGKERCFSTNPEAREAARRRAAEYRDDWTLVDKSVDHPMPIDQSVVLRNIDSDSRTARITVSCGGVSVGSFDQVAAGDTLEIGVVEYTVAEVAERTVELKPKGV